MTLSAPNPKGRPTVSPFLLSLALAGLACAGPGPGSDTTPAPASRIVSLAPNLTETLFALGLDSAVVGATDFCDLPPGAPVTRVGGMTGPSFEVITELAPDLILMTIAGNARADHDRLVSLGFRVAVTDPSTIEGIYESIAMIGSLAGRNDRADSLVRSLRQRQQELAARAADRPTRNVLLLVSVRPLIAAGGGTFLHELIALANGRNVAAEAPTAYPMLSREHILETNPDVLIILDGSSPPVHDLLSTYPEWQRLSAVRRGAVHVLDADVVTRPGPRIMQGLELLVSAIG